MPTRRQLWTRATVGTLTLATATALTIWSNATFGRHSTLGYTAELISQLLGLAAASTLLTTIRSARAHLRKPQ